VSPTARRAYFRTLLFAFTALLLLGIAVTAYITFYLSYVPIRGFTQPIYFQFNAGANPFAIVPLRKGVLVSDQPYDVRVSLNLPRTPSNTAAGNFMIDLQLLGPPTRSTADKEQDILVRESRPAILTYYSPPMELAQKAFALPLYVLGFRKEAEKLDVSIMEGVEFARGWKNLPASARVEITNAGHMQVYNAFISFRIRLKGLR
jgi:seipin